jgi:hypothetical protein
MTLTRSRATIPRRKLVEAGHQAGEHRTTRLAQGREPARERIRQLRVGRHRRPLFLPKIEIATDQTLEFGRF